MITKPLLILAFNRPSHVKKLIDSLRPHAPQKILVSVDGPRKGNKTDLEKISQVLEEIKKVDWTHDIELRIREKNVGLRFAVADAVTWAIDKYGEVIVVEDDIEVGPEFLDFMSRMLDEFRNNETIGHISGYNLVPEEFISNSSHRLRFSQIPESYAWATWRRAWQLYDPKLRWAAHETVSSLTRFVHSRVAALVWKLNFFDARRENINTWAYRWIATLWQHELFCISPNRNLISYNGRSDGTHTRTKPRWAELDILGLEEMPLVLPNGVDVQADNWINKNIFQATLSGLVIRAFASLALDLIRRIPKI